MFDKIAKPMLCAALLLVVASACTQRSDPTFTQKTAFGILQVTIITSGANQDADGYTLVVDEAHTVSIGINETSEFNLVADRYDVHLQDIASNCSASPNPLIIQVFRDQTSEGLIEVTCT